MEPNAFMDLDTLKTLAGQVLAVGMVTQMVKASVPNLSTYLVRLTSISIAIVLHIILVWQSEMRASEYMLAILNGTLVAMLAQKGAEYLKGDKRNDGRPT